MPDLKDGESTTMQGSARRPYVLKNLGGVYSCSCPAWRNQSLPIERRSCKHLRQLRGDQAEQKRIGQPLPKSAKAGKSKTAAPKLLLAQVWEPGHDPAGWWLSEKLDGVRALWDGRRFVSRQGHTYRAPAWFRAGLPRFPLDGELWLGRKSFQRTVSIVRRHDEPDAWREVAFVVFDAPGLEAVFETRQAFLEATFGERRPPFARWLKHERCTGLNHLQDALARIESEGGEGLMLRQPESRYEAGRSGTLLKVKTFHDAEAVVVDHVAGRGRHKGRLGALRVELADGTSFSVGTGFSDAQRESPPTIGSMITFRYQERTDGGVPRFPSFVRGHEDAGVSSATQPASTITHKLSSRPAPHDGPSGPAATRKNPKMATRHFEFIGGNSRKFWEITMEGRDVTVRYGRIGTDGQSQTKSFDDETAAQCHAEKLVASKIKKGYRETAA